MNYETCDMNLSPAFWICAHICAYVCVCVRTRAYACACVRMCAYVLIRVRMCACVRVCLHMCAYAFRFARMCADLRIVSVRVRMCNFGKFLNPFKITIKKWEGSMKTFPG